MLSKQGYSREEPHVLRVVVRLRRVREAVCVHQGVITRTTPQPGIHTLRLLREVGDRYPLIEEAISCEVTRFRHSGDSVDSLTGSPIVGHVRVNQSVKSWLSYSNFFHKISMSHRSGGARGSYQRR